MFRTSKPRTSAPSGTLRTAALPLCVTAALCCIPGPTCIPFAEFYVLASQNVRNGNAPGCGLCKETVFRLTGMRSLEETVFRTSKPRPCASGTLLTAAFPMCFTAALCCILGPSSLCLPGHECVPLDEIYLTVPQIARNGNVRGCALCKETMLPPRKNQNNCDELNCAR